MPNTAKPPLSSTPDGSLAAAARDPDPDPELEVLTAQLHSVFSELKRIYQFRDRDQICCYDISVTQCWALDALVRHGSLMLNQLAAELYLDKSTASRVVNALERKGYVQRARHSGDGRAIALSATPEGVRLQEKIEREILKQEQGLLEEFDPEVRQSMIRLLGRLTEVAAIEAAGRCCELGRSPASECC